VNNANGGRIRVNGIDNLSAVELEEVKAGDEPIAMTAEIMAHLAKLGPVKEVSLDQIVR